LDRASRYSGANLLALVLPFIFLSCASPPPAQTRLISDTQDSYAALAETVPALLVLPASAASPVAQETLHALEEALRRRLVADGKFRPVTMGKWLAASFSRRKAASAFAFLSALREERYSAPLLALCKPHVFGVPGFYGLHLNVFPLAGSLYPVSVLRFFREDEDPAEVAAACLEELSARFLSASGEEGKKRVAVESFRLEFRKLLELESGEFEFIEAPLAVQNGLTLRETDDFFSLLVGYCLAATDMLKVMRLADFSDYARAEEAGRENADYLVRGRLQLSEEVNILYADVYAAGGGAKIFSVRHPFQGSGLKTVWEACREAASRIIEHLFPAQAFGRVPPLAAEGRGFFHNSMLIGQDSLEHYLLPRGMHEIRVGSYLREATAGKEEQTGAEVFYVLLDTESKIFRGRQGEYVWNLLKK
jgi:hypothetical protein